MRSGGRHSTLPSFKLLLFFFIAVHANASEAALKRGTDAYEKGDYDTALQEFTQVIQGQPSSGEAYLARGRVYEAEAKYDFSDCGFYEGD